MQMWPVLKKYGLGQSVIPQKYREMMALAAAGAMKCLIVRHFLKKRQRCIELVKELNELAAILAQTSFWSAMLHTQNYDLKVCTGIASTGRLYVWQEIRFSYFLPCHPPS